MESNGKRVAQDGSVLPFEAGEIGFGEPGTNGQHSFYQLVHQASKQAGSNIAPLPSFRLLSSPTEALSPLWPYIRHTLLGPSL